MEQTAGLHVLCLTLRRRCRLSSLEVPPRGPLVMILGIYACVSSRIDAISSAVDMVSLPDWRYLETEAHMEAEARIGILETTRNAYETIERD